MDATITQIKDWIITLLGTITNINEVSWFVKTNIKYPYCFVKYRTSDNVVISTWKRYKKEHVFDIQVWYNYDNDEDAEEFTITLAQNLLDLFNNNPSLNWLVNFVQINQISEDILDDDKKEKIVNANITVIIQ